MSTRALEVRTANPPLTGTDLAALKNTLSKIPPTEVGFDQDVTLGLAIGGVHLVTWKSPHHGMIEGALSIPDPVTGESRLSLVHLNNPSLAITTVLDQHIRQYALHALVDFKL